VARLIPPIGLGCQRLSAVPREHAIATVHAALDSGVRLLETADVYAPDDASIGHNEVLVAEALAGWDGPRDEVFLVTKGGLTRRGTRWRPDGRAKHLRAAFAASLARLGRIDLYLLHAPDRARFDTSLRTLAKLGVRVGLCNVTVDQLDHAAGFIELAAVSVELSPSRPVGAHSGVAAWCSARGIPLLAWRPLGGPRGAKALRHASELQKTSSILNISPPEVALAGLCDLGLVPLAGATRPLTAATLGAAPGRPVPELGWAWAARVDPRWAERAPDPASEREVLLVMGGPASGKTGLACILTERGYARLNRDDRGGTLRGLLGPLDDLLTDGTQRVVLDNTYPTRASRAAVVNVAWAHGVPVRLWWRDTPRAEAEVNAIGRILEHEGRLLAPPELAKAPPDAPWRLPPRALTRFAAQLERPRPDEGFADIVRAPFERIHRTGAGAVFLAGDALTAEAAQAYPGQTVLGLTWHPTDHDAAPALSERHGVPLAVCPHPGGPPICWCRPPLPGLVLWWIHQHGLDPRECTLVGDGAWAAMARTLGMQLG
jgi:diketogulonate reductase-like aldo/keto reductase